MVRTALVLVEAASDKAQNIANLTKHLDGVRAVHMVSESYGIIALLEAGDSGGIRDTASRIALTSGVFRCVVCSERELTETDSLEWTVCVGIEQAVSCQASNLLPVRSNG